jgi:hypothetical protein
MQMEESLSAFSEIEEGFTNVFAFVGLFSIGLSLLLFQESWSVCPSFQKPLLILLVEPLFFGENYQNLHPNG